MWFGLNGVKVAAAAVLPKIINPGLETVWDGETDELVTKLGRWSVIIDIDNGDAKDYAALVQNLTRVYLLFTDLSGTYRRGLAYLVATSNITPTRLRLEWHGTGVLR